MSSFLPYRPKPVVVSKTLPDLPKALEYPGGRIAWPTIVMYQYENEPNQAHDFPPGFGVAYSLIIRDQARYDRLKAEGWLADPRHTGFELRECVDNRGAPQS